MSNIRDGTYYKYTLVCLAVTEKNQIVNLFGACVEYSQNDSRRQLFSHEPDF